MFTIECFWYFNFNDLRQKKGPDFYARLLDCQISMGIYSRNNYHRNAVYSKVEMI